MALFSPEFQSLFPVRELDIGKHYGGSNPGLSPYFHYQGSISAFMEGLRGEYLKSRALATYLGDKSSAGSSWAGFVTRETLPDMLRTAHCETAYQAFMNAKAKVSTPYTKAKPELAVAGSSYSVGRMIIGHPKAAFNRPKTKLPAKTLEYSISVSGSVDYQAVADSMAKIVNAAAHYHQAGGPVHLTVHYLLGFHKNNPETNAQGLAFSFDIPLNSLSLAAFSASIQFFRGFAIPVAQALSGVRYDSLQCMQFRNKKGLVGIHGRALDCESTLDALKIA